MPTLPEAAGVDSIDEPLCFLFFSNRVLVGKGVDGFFGEGALFFVAVVDEAFDDFEGEEFAELVGVAAEGDDLFDEGGGGESEFFAGHDEDGFDTGDLSVGEGDAELVVEVGEVAEASEDGGGFAVADEGDGEAGVGFDGDVGEFFGEFFDEGEAFLDGEEVFFFGVDADGDDEVVEEFSAPVDNVEVAEGERVEGSGEDGDFMGRAGHGDLVLGRR